MFDITYLGRRCFRFIRRYPRTWITIGFLLIFGIGVWLGQTVQFSKITDYFRSFSDRDRTDVTKSVARGIVHRHIQDKGVLTNILAVSPAKGDTSIFESRHIVLRKSTHRSSKIEGGNITPTIRRRMLSTTALLSPWSRRSYTRAYIHI